MKHAKRNTSLVSHILNFLLLITFLLSIMVPLTGIHIHKLASLLFLLLCIVHTIIYRKRLGMKRYLLLLIILISFVSGIFGMILNQYPIVMQLHRGISIAVVFFLAIHIFVYRNKLKPRKS